MHNRELKFGYQHLLLCQKSFLKVSSKWLLKNKSDNGKLLLGKTYSGERFRAILVLLLNLRFFALVTSCAAFTEKILLQISLRKKNCIRRFWMSSSYTKNHLQTTCQNSQVFCICVGKKKEPPGYEDEDQRPVRPSSSDPLPSTSAGKKDRKFQQVWLEKYGWLWFQKDRMFCDACISAKALSNPCSEGCLNFQNSTLTRHEQSKAHLSSVQVLNL